MTMGDRIAVLDEGELQQVGPPMELYYRPTNEFVATFIGSPSMNVLDATYDGDALALGGFDYALTDEQRADLDESLSGNAVRLGIRPEDVEFVAESGPRTAEFTAGVVEPMGDENVVHLAHEMGELIATISGSQVVRKGDTVRARLPSDHVHAFDARTGDAVFNRTRTEETATGVVGRPGSSAVTRSDGGGEP
jgi:multiple sugar transport system ATP-binding protein